MYCCKDRCYGCKHLPQNSLDFQQEQEQKIINIELKEAEKPKKLIDRPREERREFVDNINAQIAEYTESAREGIILPGPVGELLRIAKQLNRAIMWVYYTLDQKTCTPEERQNKKKAVNIPLLHEMARQMQYKPAWVYFKKKDLEEKVE